MVLRRIFIALFALLVAGAVALAAYHSVPTGHPKELPAIAAGFDRTLGPANDAMNTTRWTDLLRRQYRVGSSATAMEDDLREQGFNIDLERRLAGFEWGGLPCLNLLSVVWVENATHRLTAVRGAWRTGCR